jgi:hypothetical protein
LHLCNAMPVSGHRSRSSRRLPSGVRYSNKKCSSATHRQNCVFLRLFVFSINFELRQLYVSAMRVWKPFQSRSEGMRRQILQWNLAVLQDALLRVRHFSSYSWNFHCFHLISCRFCKLEMPICSAPASQIQASVVLLVASFLFGFLQQ